MPAEYFPGRERPGQCAFDDLGTPLADVTFVVVDLETTGGSPASCAITEVGAVKYRGGECLGELSTLVNPGVAIPPMITVLTGITEAMVLPAPRIGEVLPALLEFVGPAESGTVICGHNLRFDVSFLDAALIAHERSRLRHRRVDTIALARRLLRDEVPNLRLATLARHLRVTTEPIHRALPDARATLEVLHVLLERAASYGVFGLDDLLSLPSLRAHPSSAKLVLTRALPRLPGVYQFRDRGGRVIYVGKASNLRTRVRSYFSGDDRRKVPQLLRETETIDHRVCVNDLEAAVREIRLIHLHEPRFNRRAKAWRSYGYLELRLDERFPRLAVVREVRRRDNVFLGPFTSTAAAQAARDAIESALPLRRCTRRIGRAQLCDGAPCVAAQLGACLCPCSGAATPAEYDTVVASAVCGLTEDPTQLLDPLEQRMRRLATEERYEEAALARDRLRSLAAAFDRQRLVDALKRAGRISLSCPDTTMTIVGGRLVLADDADDSHGIDQGSDGDETGGLGLPVGRAAIDELLTIARWLRKTQTVSAAEGRPLSWPAPLLSRYEPVRAPLRPRR